MGINFSFFSTLSVIGLSGTIIQPCGCRVYPSDGLNPNRKVVPCSQKMRKGKFIIMLFLKEKDPLQSLDDFYVLEQEGSILGTFQTISPV